MAGFDWWLPEDDYTPSQDYGSGANYNLGGSDYNSTGTGLTLGGGGGDTGGGLTYNGGAAGDYDPGSYDYSLTGGGGYNPSGATPSDYGSYGGTQDSPTPQQWGEATQGQNRYSMSSAAPTPSGYGAGLKIPSAVAPAAPAASTPSAAVSGSFGGALGGVRGWAAENPELAKLGVQTVAGLLTKGSSSAAKQQISRATAAQDANAAVAAKKTVAADQMMADATNIDPQQYGIDAMNKSQARTSAATARNTSDMQKRGMSEAAIAAEKRRASLGGTQAGYQAYAQGSAQGKANRTAGLSTASSMYPTSAGFDTSLYNATTAGANSDRSNMADWLEYLAGNPTRRIGVQQ